MDLKTFCGKEKGILTVGVVTKPCRFEAKTRMNNALLGIDKIKEHVDTLIVIPNDKLLQICSKNTSIPEALKKADEVLQQGVQGVAVLHQVRHPAVHHSGVPAPVRTALTAAA